MESVFSFVVSDHLIRRGRKETMLKLKLQQLLVRLVKDQKGQDMVEYALLAGFIAVAAGAILPGISDNISVIFSKMASVVTAASTA